MSNNKKRKIIIIKMQKLQKVIKILREKWRKIKKQIIIFQL